jgi:hypothetical protein
MRAFDRSQLIIEIRQRLGGGWSRRNRDDSPTRSILTQPPDVHHAILASLPSRHIHVPAFGRFDEITYLVEKAPGLAHLLRRPDIDAAQRGSGDRFV